MYERCEACPRNCGVDRNAVHGFCSSGNKVKVARASRHMWEEPCISGVNGSGTVFFSGCNHKCVFCQNEKISRGKTGVELSCEEHKRLFLEINESGAHNINLVTPTHFMPSILEVLGGIKNELKIPVVYNCSGYESVKMLKASKDIIDIYLTDIKYKSKVLSEKYSSCADYFEKAIPALKVMLENAGKPVIEDGLMKKGVIVRHLILPSHKDDSIDILRTLYEEFGNKKFLVSLMSQYTPMSACVGYPEINRRLTKLEYQRVVEIYEKLNFDGFLQEISSSSDSYIPDFDEYGEFLKNIIK